MDVFLVPLGKKGINNDHMVLSFRSTKGEVDFLYGLGWYTIRDRGKFRVAVDRVLPITLSSTSNYRLTNYNIGRAARASSLHLAPTWVILSYILSLCIIPAVLSQSTHRRRGTEYMYFLTWNSLRPREATRIYPG